MFVFWAPEIHHWADGQCQLCICRRGTCLIFLNSISASLQCQPRFLNLGHLQDVWTSWWLGNFGSWSAHISKLLRLRNNEQNHSCIMQLFNIYNWNARSSVDGFFKKKFQLCVQQLLHSLKVCYMPGFLLNKYPELIIFYLLVHWAAEYKRTRGNSLIGLYSGTKKSIYFISAIKWHNCWLLFIDLKYQGRKE